MIKMPYLLMMVCAWTCSCSSEEEDPADAGSDDAAVDTGQDGTLHVEGDADNRDDAGDGEAAVEADIEEDIEDPPLEWEVCDTTDWPAGFPLPPLNMECTFIDVPVDYEDPTGPTLSLRVARHSSGTVSAERAVFFLEGGPGYSSVTTSGIYNLTMPGLVEEFDLIYMDQRGVGGSGHLSCSLEAPGTVDEWISCARSLPEIDLNAYLSKVVAQDLDAVRERLGFEEIYLYGASYGTRVAFDYLRLFEDRVVAAILDGVAPPPVDLFSDTVTSSDRGIHLLIEDCSSDPECLEVSPTFEEDLRTRRLTLRDTPREIYIDGTLYVEAEFDYLVFLRTLIKSYYWRYRIPRAIHQAVEGNHNPWNRLLSEAMGAIVTDAVGTSPTGAPEPLRARLDVRSLNSPFAQGLDSWGPSSRSHVVWMSMLCAEILPNSDGPDALYALLDEQTWAVTNIVEAAEACAEWPVDPIPLSEREYLTVDTSILLLSGEIDVNVNPSWAVAAEGALSNATHLLVPYSTHNATYVPCVGQINVDFYTADGDISLVDTFCVEELPPPTWD